MKPTHILYIELNTKCSFKKIKKGKRKPMQCLIKL